MYELTRQFLAVMSNRGLQRLLNAVTVILLARCLSLGDFGAYGIFVTTTTIACMLGAAGIRQSTAYFIGQDPSHDGETLAGGLMLLAPVAILSTVGAIAWFAVARHAGGTEWLWPALFTVTGTTVVFVAQGNNLGRGHIGAFNLSETMPCVLLLLGVAALYVAGSHALTWILWVVAGTSVVVGAGSMTYVLIKKRSRLDWKLASSVKLVSMGVPYAAAVSFGTFNNSVGLYVLSIKGFAHATAYFYMAWQINNAILNMVNAIGLVFFSQGTRSKDPVQTLTQVARLTSMLMWFMLLAGAVMAVVVPWLVPWVFGAHYRPTVPYIQVMLCSMALVSLSRIIYPTLGGLGLPYLALTLLVPAIVVNFAICWFLLDWLGLMGPVIGLVITQAAVAIGYLVIIKLKFGLSPWLFVIPARSDIDKACSFALNAAQAAKKRLSSAMQ